jgi:dual specificity MAP kinase phosphatase
MTTLCAPPAPFSTRSPSPAPSLSINTSVRGTPVPVPNKHLPICSPGPRPQSRQLATPPASPASSHPFQEHTSLLYPPEAYSKLSSRPPVYRISGDELNAAIHHIASQPLPDPKQVFPWLHGLHAENSLQLAFFIARKKSLRRTPRCIRSLTIVKANGELSHSRLKGAIAPEEALMALRNGEELAQFLDLDPKDGFSVRNFHIQAAKMATVSDIVVYRDSKTSLEDVKKLADRISRAQRAWREREKEAGVERPLFSTFVLEGKHGRLDDNSPLLLDWY